MGMNLRQNADGSAVMEDDSSTGKQATVLRLDSGNKVFSNAVNTVARTDTAAKTLFTLPANAVPIGLTIIGPAVSNAGTTATLSVGKSGGTNAEYLSALDVKGATGSGQQTPAGVAGGLGSSVGTAALGITGIYAETGTASTSGGPWTVVMDYYIP